MSFTVSGPCRSGTFSNGLSFYVQKNCTPEKRAVLRLTVKCGSMMEDEHERGIAHFLEHCAFRSTESYGHGELVEYFQSIGSAFGPDVNASTSLTNTVYKLTVPLNRRTEEKEHVHNKEDLYKTPYNKELCTAIKVLSEFAFKIRIADEDVEAERNVILEEWRGNQGTSQRMLKHYWEEVFDGTKFAVRMPIGLMDTIKTCSSETIKRFYKKHYVPENMAVVVVGDVDVERTIAYLEKIFCDDVGANNFTAKTPKPSLSFAMPAQSKPKVILVKDKELTQSSISVEYFEEYEPSNSKAFLKNEMLKRVFSSALDRRILLLCKNLANLDEDATISKLKDSCVISGGVSISTIVPKLMRTSVSFVFPQHHQNALVEGLHLVARELVRVQVHGFEKGEVNHAKIKWMNTFKSRNQNLRDVSSNEIVDDCVSHFLSDGKTIFGGASNENLWSIQALLSVTTDEVNEYVKAKLPIIFPFSGGATKLAAPKDGLPNMFQALSLQLSGVLGENVDESTVAKLFEEGTEKALSANLAKWPNFSSKTNPLLITNPPSKGSIVEESDLEKCGAHLWTLSNGIEIIWKKTKWKQGKISFQAFSLGGRSELSEMDDTVFCLLGDIADNSGMGEWDGAEIANLSHTNTRVNTQSHLFIRGLGGSGVSGENAELLFQMLHLKLTDQPISEIATSNVCERARQMVLGSKSSPEIAFLQSIKQHVYGDVPILRDLTLEGIDNVTSEKVKALYDRAFTNESSKFSFAFIGDIHEPEFQNLLEVYLASIPMQSSSGTKFCCNPSSPRPKTLPVIFPGAIETHEQKTRIAKKCDVFLTFISEVPDDYVRHLQLAKCVCTIGRTKLLEELRQKRGGIYTVSMNFDYGSCAKYGILAVQFSCASENREELVQLAHSTLKRLIDDGPSYAEVEAMKETLSKQHELKVQDNSHWLFWMLNSQKVQKMLLSNPEVKESTKAEARTKNWLDSHLHLRGKGMFEYLKSITPQNIREAASELLCLDTYRVHMLVPMDQVSATPGSGSDPRACLAFEETRVTSANIRANVPLLQRKTAHTTKGIEDTVYRHRF